MPEDPPASAEIPLNNPPPTPPSPPAPAPAVITRKKGKMPPALKKYLAARQIKPSSGAGWSGGQVALGVFALVCLLIGGVLIVLGLKDPKAGPGPGSSGIPPQTPSNDGGSLV